MSQPESPEPRRQPAPASGRYHCLVIGNIGLTEIVVVLAIALIVFGPKRLPELGRSLGNGIREFRGSLSGEDEESAPPQREIEPGKSEPVASKRP